MLHGLTRQNKGHHAHAFAFAFEMQFIFLFETSFSWLSSEAFRRTGIEGEGEKEERRDKKGEKGRGVEAEERRTAMKHFIIQNAEQQTPWQTCKGMGSRVTSHCNSFLCLHHMLLVILYKTSMRNQGFSLGCSCCKGKLCYYWAGVCECLQDRHTASLRVAA